MAENARTRTGSLIAETTIDIPTSSAPSAIAGRARLYFDTSENKLKLAENGGSFVDVVGGDTDSPAQQRHAIDAAKESNAGLYSVSKWYPQTAAAAQTWNGICWSPDLGMFAAVSSDGGTNQVMTSTNGRDWTLRASTLNSSWASICWARYSSSYGLFVAVDLPTPHVITSPDGITWTQHDSPISTWTSVCFSPELFLLVAVASDATGGVEVMTSPDGATWTSRTESETNAWQSVCWSPELGLFLAVSSDGTHRVMTSPNGINWTSRTASTQDAWMSVCWSPELNLFVAVSSSGTSMYSENGINWTTGESITNHTWRSVCWSPELGYFVAVALDGSLSVSARGTNDWTSKTSAEANQWSSICWAPEIGLFAAVSKDGTHRVMTSRRFNENDYTQSNGTFIAEGDAITKTFVVRGTTTDASPYALTPDGVPVSQLLVMPNYSTWHYKIRIVAQSVPSGQVAVFELNGGIWRATNAASTALMAAADQTFSQNVSNTWTVDTIADTTYGALIVAVTGEAAVTIQWVAKVEIVQTLAAS